MRRQVRQEQDMQVITDICVQSPYCHIQQEMGKIKLFFFSLSDTDTMQLHSGKPGEICDGDH